jgi:extracellular elastinolytic metalloproteinase
VSLIPLSTLLHVKGMFVTPIRNRSLAVAAIGSTVLAVSMLGLPSQAATSGGGSRVHASDLRGADATVRTPGYFDVRHLGGTALVKSDRAQVADRTKSDKVYYRSLGSQAVVDMDPLTHTARDFGRLDGFLTGRSSAPARTVAMNYVRSHAAALGLTKADLATFRFRQDYVDAAGVHNLSWNQSVGGATVFGNGLKVKVTRDGRVLAVQGSPVSGLAKLAAAAPSATKVSATSARATAAKNVNGSVQKVGVTAARSGSTAATVWANNDYAKRVWFLTPQGLRPGWSTYVQTSRGAYQHVVDAITGKVLFRHANFDDANGDARVYDNYPGAARGGKARVVNFIKRGWLTKRATFLKGSSVTAFADLNDDDAIEASEKTPVPGTRHGSQFRLKKYGTRASDFCAQWVCTWNPHVVGSWRTNMNEDTSNGFYFASNFHDYLAKPPIKFTRAAGNFSAKDHDPVRLNTLDGANTNNGMPDGSHIDNANMSTPPDGISPTMQMYLFHVPFTSDDPATGDPFVPTTGSLDASVEYHEYTHGLSNRLVIDANGNSTLNSIQSGAMGEAWSDYYAMDYLVTKGFLRDTKKPGNLLEGNYVAAKQHLIRTMAIDCPVGVPSKGCTSGFDPSVKGGYTYGDFPTIVGSPEVHGSGEIWGQTLWDLRKKLGHKVADTLITRAMSLSADDPSYLDMRDAILRADVVAFGRSHTDAIWKVFAHRGMGFFAGAVDSTDTTPGEDFHVPPVNNPHDGKIAGTVTDPTTGQPVAGAVVQVTGQGDQYKTTTDAAGKYAITNLVTGTYAKVVANAPGYFGAAHPGTAVSAGSFTPADATDFQITRDWASLSGGATVTRADGPDFSFVGCGPDQAFDTNLGTSWVTAAGDAGEPSPVFKPKTIEVQLPQAVDIDSFGVDPSETCGTGTSSATGELLIETSTDGITWIPAADPTFGAGDVGHLNQVPATAGTTGVRFVRATIESNQVPAPFSDNCPNGGFGGCQFSSLTELSVSGTPAS